MPRLTRQDRILAMTDLGQGPGLEISPLHRPIASKTDWDVRYVDILSTDQLREHYHDDASVPNEDIVDVDYSLTGPDGTIRPLSQVAKDGSPFAWVIASHVIEHVPDLITWLEDIAELLEDGGALVLVIPDARYSFDAFRPQTTVGQMLQARDQRDVVPSVRAVYDHLYSASAITPSEAWAGKLRSLKQSRIHEHDYVMPMVERARDGEYIDSHVWTFRPSTFVEQINELGRLDLCEFVVERTRNTRPDRLEFLAVLRRLPRNRTTEQDAQLRAAGKQRTNDDPDRFRKPVEAPTMALSERERRLIERKRAAVRAARRVLGRH